MLNTILKNWNFVRLLRLAIGVFLFVEALISQKWFLVAVGAIFVLMPLLNFGCCATGDCAVPQNNPKKSSDEVEYEEIK